MLSARVTGAYRTVRARDRLLTGTAVAATLALAATGCSDGARATPRITTTVKQGVAPTPPQRGAYFGAWVSPDERTALPSGGPSPSKSAKPSPDESSSSPASLTAVEGFERQLGRKLDIAQSYHGWKSDFPDDSDKAVLASDRYLMLSWSAGDTKQILEGKFDDMVRQRARALKATRKPVFLRWQRDMDRVASGKIHTPVDYVAAWKHLRLIFHQEKVDNVAWVWCPSARAFPDAADDYYPGDGEVDWVCANVFPTADYDYRDLSEVARRFLEWAQDHPRPVMIGEFGVPASYGSRRAEWLRNASKYLQEHPQVKAVGYFDSDEDAEEPRDQAHRFSVSGDKRAVSALRELATMPFFNPRNLPVTPGS
ncbi:glycoside hydrolase family 26 protein [Actinomadura oligospora]|uniref:glycoside hydrolase family 26 protein n=1 Tax=Actinomadura oligospora TaxID=111804 RepID=UPI0006841847|nr:glycosyl hydrolase [Actinomadura oligospora]